MRNITDVLLRVSLILTVLVAAAVPVFAQEAVAAIPVYERDVYAVKFLCGSLKPVPTSPPTNGIEWPVKPGNYLTAINVHNPNSFPVVIRKKAVLLYRADKVQPHETPAGPLKELLALQLKPDWGVEIDCPDIRQKLLDVAQVPAPLFIKGWVIIEVHPQPVAGVLMVPPIDVTAVYTSHGWRQSAGQWLQEGFAEDVESVLPKRVK